MAAVLVDADTPLRRQFMERMQVLREQEAVHAGRQAAQRLPWPVRPFLGWAVEAMAREDARRHRHRAVRSGEQAEDQVLSDLMEVLEQDWQEWYVFRRLVLQAKAGARPLEIDTLVLGPCGLIPVETKGWRGDVVLGEDMAYVRWRGEWRRRKSPLLQLRQIAGLLIRLTRSAGLQIPLATVVCLPRVEPEDLYLGLPEGADLRSVILCGPDAGRELGRQLLSAPADHASLMPHLLAVLRWGAERCVAA